MKLIRNFTTFPFLVYFTIHFWIFSVLCSSISISIREFKIGPFFPLRSFRFQGRLKLKYLPIDFVTVFRIQFVQKDLINNSFQSVLVSQYGNMKANTGILYAPLCECVCVCAVLTCRRKKKEKIEFNAIALNSICCFESQRLLLFWFGSLHGWNVMC